MIQRPEIAIDVTIDHSGWADMLSDVETLAEDILRQTLSKAPLPDDIGNASVPLLEASLRLTSDADVHALNRDYRGQNKPTNVLSFAQMDDGLTVMDGVPILLGDVVIAFETCQREAEDQSKPFQAHVTHLIIHGGLHLFGFDHQDDADAQDMEDWERRLMVEFGLLDPYNGH